MKRKLPLKKYLFLLGIFLTCFKQQNLYSQGTTGKDFWIAFMAQDWGCYYSNYYNTNDTPMVFLSSQYHATVTIKAPGQNFTTSVTLTPNITKAVQLPNTTVCRYSDTVTTNGVNVSSDSSINVYAVNRFWYSKGATVVIPSESIVKSPEYVVTTAKDGYNWGWYCNGKQIRSPEFTIVGIADSSVIEIVPTGASSRNSAANVPFQITLRKGETFQYITTDDDLTGTIIRTKYIESKYGVFSGNRQNVIQRQMPGGGTCNSSWDHTFEQMTPTITWGNNYTAMPFKRNPKGYTLKIVAAEHNTRVFINGSYVTTLGQGKYYVHDVYTDTIVRISSTNRISVGQFTVGSGYWGTGNNNCKNHPTDYMGDPAQLQLFPDEQFGNNATINTVSENNNWWYWNWWWNQYKPEHYINIMTKTSDTADFLLNYKKVNNNEWKTAGNFSGFHFAQIKIDSGSHYLKSNKGFLSYVYGYSAFEGYAYAAAANFKPIQNNFIITNAQCIRDTTFFQTVLNDSFSNFSWHFGVAGATASGTKVKYKYKDTGWFTVKMFSQHVRTGKKDTVVKSLYIADTKIKSLFNKDTAICGPLNMIVISKGFNMDNEYAWNDGWPVYYRAIKTPGIYWLDVKERNGCVYRDSLVVANYQFPKARFDVSDTLFCFNKNKNIKINNFSSSKDSIIKYTWEYGDGNSSTRDSIHYFKYSKPGYYAIQLSVLTKYGCRHDTFKIIEVLKSPKPDFEFTKKDTCFYTNGISLKNNTVIDNTLHRRYKWYFSEGFVISNNNPSGVRTYSNPGKYSINLIYENNNGCIDTLTKKLEIFTHPKAEFTYPNTAFCARDSISFKAQSDSRYTALRFNWTWGDGNKTSSYDSFIKHVYVTDNVYNVKQVTVSAQGCKDSIIKTITVNSNPNVDFIINNDTQCFKNHVFNFINTTTGKTKNSYTWNFGDGSNSNDSNYFNKTYSKDSVYLITLTANTLKSCQSSVTKTIRLGTYPKANFSILKDKQCFKNNTFNFTSTSTIKKGNINTYKWSFGDNTNANTSSINNKTYNTEDSFNVELITYSDLGCTDTISKQVIVFAQPKSNFTINNNAQCLNENNVVFSNTTTLKYGTISYLWNFGNSQISSSKDNVVKYNNHSNYNVSLISTSDNGCKDTITKQVQIFASPTASFINIKDKQCFRDNRFNFINNSTVATGNITDNYWNLGDGNTFNQSVINNYKYLSEDTFNIQLVVKTNNNCYDTAYSTSVTFPQPKANFSINELVQCYNQQNFLYNNSSSLSEGSLTYDWNLGDASNSSNKDIVKKYSNPGQYLIRLISISDDNCRDTINRSVTLYESPKSKFAIDKSKQCFRGNVFNFSNQSTYIQDPIAVYYWDLDNGFTSNSTSILNYNFNTEDTFNVRLIAQSSKNCFDTSYSTAITFAQPIAKFSVPNDSQCWQKNFFVINNNTTLKYGTLTNSWDFGDATYSSDFTPSNKRYPNTSGSYIIKYKTVSDNGCSDSAQKRVALLERPISEFDINDSIQCFKSHLFNFNNKTTFSAMYSLRYWWDYNNGDTSIGIVPKSATYANPGLYNVRLISYSYLTNCYDTLFKQVIPAPHAQVNFNINKDSQCLRFNDFVFSNTSNVQFGSNKYLWNFGDNSSDTNTNINHHYLSENAYTIKLVATTNYDCKDSISKSVGFYATPKANFIVNDSTQCFNKHLFNWQNTSSISRGSFQSYWYFSDNSSSNVKDLVNKTFNSPLYTNYYLSVLSDKGCTDTSFSRLYLEKQGNLSINLTQNDSQCLRGNQFDFNTINNNTSVNIINSHWVFGDGQESFTNVPATQSFLTDGNYKVLLSAQSAVGCYDSSYIDVVVHPHPVSDFTTNDVCFPEPVVFVNNSSIKKGNISNTKWHFGDGKVSFINSPTYVYKNHGIYSIALISTSQYGCVDSIFKSNKVIVKEKPKANFSFSKLPTTVLEQTRLQFKQTASSDVTRFNWDFGNSTFSQDADPIGLYDDTGRFNVTQIVWNANNCSDTITKNTGLLLPDFFINIPNAFSPDKNGINEVFLPIASKYVREYTFEIYNRWGELIYRTNDIKQGWDGTYKGEKCMEGVYMYRIYVIPMNGAKRGLSGNITLLK